MAKWVKQIEQSDNFDLLTPTPNTSFFKNLKSNITRMAKCVKHDKENDNFDL